MKKTITDYWYRANTLHDMNFYDFARCVSLQVKPKAHDNVACNGNSNRHGTLTKHALLHPHPLANSHHLVQHTNDIDREDGKQYVPRIVGSRIPRQNTGNEWKLFTLAHFKPFNIICPLIENESNIQNTYDSFSFSERSLQIMKNWEATHECEDKRDEERLRKRAEMTSESAAMTKSLNEALPLETDIPDISSVVKRSPLKDFNILQTIHVLEESRWLIASNTPIDTLSLPCNEKKEPIPHPSTQQIKIWLSVMKQQEKVIIHQRQNGNLTGKLSVVMKTKDTNNTETFQNSFLPLLHCPTTHSETQSKKGVFSEEDIINTVGNNYNLQSQQWIAFRIIARSFIRRYVFKYDDENPLRMLLTGPGGTGKSHVVKAVQSVMEYYNASHTIRFLAPTGSAASLIDGMTIHKGLGIKVQSNEKGKGNRKLGEHHEDYNVIINVQNKIKLRNEWHLVEIVMIDECSLLSAELLSEIDAALRFAKETPHEWFGGIIVIFAGDFYQYPPVCATPLYNPIPAYGKSSSSQLSKRLGRLAWKSVNNVIAFFEQKRMKDDPEYAAAVTRLRTRECTLEDVDLFNTRVIKSASIENGIDMSIEDNFNATAIVPTNLLRQTMNIRKAQTNSLKSNIPLFNCTAIDTCSTTTLTQKQHDQLLHLDMSSSKIQDSLPGFLPLYNGMPVILKSKNISTDLGITNGSQGYIRNLHLETTPTTKLIFCTCAIVEFPQSKVCLPDLPDHYFPVIPIKTTFTTQLLTTSGDKENFKITRSQLPIQPAFAVTGHSAQGKTLPTVLTNLREGGFGAYVATSRARTRYGLYITEPIQLQDLEKSLPYNLLQESKRLAGLEHNTYVQYGFRNDDYKKIIDPESEQNIPHIIPVANFDTTDTSSVSSKPSKSSTKKKALQHSLPSQSPPKHHISFDSHSELEGKKPLKRPRLESQISPNEAFTGGCVWSSLDWSCAYDCVVMSTFYAYLSFNDTVRAKWRAQTNLTNIIAPFFDNLTASSNNIIRPHHFNIVRDQLRDYLSETDQIHFPRNGPVGAPAELIFDHLRNLEQTKLCISYYCSSCSIISNKFTITTTDYIPALFFSELWMTSSEKLSSKFHPPNATIQNWLDLDLRVKQKNHSPTTHNTVCNPCLFVTHIYVDKPSPLLKFEITPGTVPIPIPSRTISLQTFDSSITYNLRAIIYLGNFHFTARLFHAEDIWIYDGQKNDGYPSQKRSWSSISNLHDLTTLELRDAHIYVYSQ